MKTIEITEFIEVMRSCESDQEVKDLISYGGWDYKEFDKEFEGIIYGDQGNSYHCNLSWVKEVLSLVAVT